MCRMDAFAFLMLWDVLYCIWQEGICMAKLKKLLIALLVLFIAWVALFVYSNPVIGIRAENVEQHAREKWTERGYLDADWQVAKAMNDTVGVFLFYDTDTARFAYTVYENYPEWYSLGYFGQGLSQYRSYQETNFVANTIQGYLNYGNDAIMLSMNKPQIAKIAYGAEGSTKAVIEVDPDQPFVAILPLDYGTITLYDRDGNISPLEYVDTPLTFVFVDRSE